MEFKEVAEQLRKPEGDLGKQVGEKMNVTNEVMNQEAIRLLQLQPNDIILEIGMGNGAFCREIFQKETGIRYTGCDFSETMVSEAQKSNHQFVETGQATFLLTDAATLPLNDSLFTKAFTVNTIYFWQEPAQVLSELKRVLQPNGKVFIGIRSREIMQHLPFVSFGFQLYSPEEVADLLQVNGFHNIEMHEIEEPEQSIHGQVLKMDSIVISGTKR